MRRVHGDSWLPMCGAHPLPSPPHKGEGAGAFFYFYSTAVTRRYNIPMNSRK
jgi:hypothetical protein